MAKFGCGDTPAAKEPTFRRMPGSGAPGAGADEAYDIRIGRDGTWYHEGRPIRRQALVRLFASVLRRDAAGDFWLVTPAERGRITVEDAPFVAVELAVAGDGPDQVLAFRTNLDEWVEAGPEHPIRVAFDPESAEPRPYIQLAEGIEALIARPVYYELAERAQEVDGRIGVWSRSRFFPLDRAG